MKKQHSIFRHKYAWRALCWSVLFTPTIVLPSVLEPSKQHTQVPQEEATPTEKEKDQHEDYWVEVKINGVIKEGIFEIKASSDQHLLIEKDVWVSWGLKFDPAKDTYMALNSVMLNQDTAKEYGIDYHFYPTTLKLELNVKPSLLNNQTIISNDANLIGEVEQSNGFLANYNLNVRQASGDVSYNGWVGSNWFTQRHGNLLNDVSFVQNNEETKLTRLDTTWVRHFPEKTLSLRVGDTIMGGPSWSRSVRMGGIWLGSDFSLQPYMNTIPLASYRGQAALPSNVELFVDGMLQKTSQTAPGEFILNDIPMGSGSNQAHVIITDINGNQQQVVIPIYGTAQLLRKGLNDGQVGIGKVRKGWGVSSFEYEDDVFVSGNIRRGVTDYFTLEAHGEHTKRVSMGGVGGVARLGSRGGVVLGSYSYSSHNEDNLSSLMEERNTTRASLEYQWSSNDFSLTMGRKYTGNQFLDIADLSEIDARHYQAGENYSIGDINPYQYQNQKVKNNSYVFFQKPLNAGGVGVGFVRNVYHNGKQEDFSNLYYSKNLSHNVSLNISLSKSEKDWGGMVNLHIPLSSNRSASLFVNHQDQTSYGVDVSTPLPNMGEGTGYRAQVSGGQNSRAHVNVQHATRYALFDLGVDYNNGLTTYGGVSGTFVYMNGAHFNRNISDSFAVLQVGDLQGIDVLLDNNLVGQTDRFGKILVPQLHSYQRNTLSIDTKNIPENYSLRDNKIVVIPGFQTGVSKTFPLEKVLILNATLSLEHTGLVREGSEIKNTQTGDTSIVGIDGVLYMENPRLGRWASEEHNCSFVLDEKALMDQSQDNKIICMENK